MSDFSHPFRELRPRMSVLANHLALVPALLALPVALIPAVQLWREEWASWWGDAGLWTFGTVVLLALEALLAVCIVNLWFGRYVVGISREGVSFHVETLGFANKRYFYPVGNILHIERKHARSWTIILLTLRGGKRVILAGARRPEELTPLWRELREWWPGRVLDSCDPPGSEVKTRFPWWALGMGLILTAIGGYLSVQNASMITHGYRVEGRVVSVETIVRTIMKPPYVTSKAYAPVVRFTDREGEVREAVSLYRYSSPMPIGDSLSGYWNPYEPEDYLPVDAFALFARPGFFLIPGLLALTLTLCTRDLVDDKK